MKRLLFIELRKISGNKSSRVLTIAYFVLLICIALFASIKFSFFGHEFRLADYGYFNFPYIWHANTYIAAILKLFLSVVVVSMIANEYSYGTLKQNLIDGLSKKEFVLSKFYTVVVFSAISTVFVFAVSLILGLIFSSYTEMGIVFSDLDYLLAYFLKLVCFFSFCIFAAMLVKRSAFALGFLFIWWIAENILEYQFINRLIPSEKVAGFVTNLLPFGAMGTLIKEPASRVSAFRQLEGQVSNAVTQRDYSVHWYELLIAAAWIFLFVLMSYKLLQKRDL